MLEIKKISPDELKEYIAIAYADDKELLEKYHVGDFDYTQAVDETLRMINTASNGIEMNYLAVWKDGEKIGYLCTFTHNLYSYGINIHYRTKEVLSEYWDKIKKQMNGSFITMLYPNNTRAIDWVKKCGMEEVKDVEDNCVVLIYVDNNIYS